MTIMLRTESVGVCASLGDFNAPGESHAHFAGTGSLACNGSP